MYAIRSYYEHLLVEVDHVLELVDHGRLDPIHHLFPGRRRAARGDPRRAAPVRRVRAAGWRHLYGGRGRLQLEGARRQLPRMLPLRAGASELLGAPRRLV